MPLEIARKNQCVPFDVENGKIKVCFADNFNKTKMDTVKLMSVSYTHLTLPTT